MFNVFGILSIAGGIYLYLNASSVASISMALYYSAGITLAGMAALLAIGMGIAGLFSLASKNGHRKICIGIASFFYLIPAAVSIVMKFDDMIMWSSLCIVMGALYLLWSFVQKYE